MTVCAGVITFPSKDTPCVCLLGSWIDTDVRSPPNSAPSSPHQPKKINKQWDWLQKLPWQFALSVCPDILLCQFGLSACPVRLLCQFARSVCSDSLSWQFALTVCPDSLPCQLPLSDYFVSLPCQFALTVCSVSLVCQLALTVCSHILPCQFALSVGLSVWPASFGLPVLACQFGQSACPVRLPRRVFLSACPISSPCQFALLTIHPFAFCFLNISSYFPLLCLHATFLSLGKTGKTTMIAVKKPVSARNEFAYSITNM
jgi:hypothetical protein